MDEIQGAKLFTKLDILLGYYEIHMKDVDIPLSFAMYLPPSEVLGKKYLNTLCIILSLPFFL